MEPCQNNTEKILTPLPSGELAAVEIRLPSKRHRAIMAASEADRARFWSKVSKEPNEKGCWIWTGELGIKGYGIATVRGFRVAAHRLSYLIHNGSLDPDLMVCHNCDNPPCVNPEHLFQGTNSDNVRDCVNKKRHSSSRVTRCPHGHEYTPENTYIIPSTQSRQCRACIAIRSKKYNQIRRENSAKA